MKPDDIYTLTLEKIINTTQAVAYDAFLLPEHVSRWFTTNAQADLIVGGNYSNADGDHGVFLALDRPERVRFTWENEQHCPGTVVEVTFSSTIGGKINVVLEHRQLASLDEVKDMQTGWSWALASLQSYLETGKPILFEEWQRKTDGSQHTLC